ncbi:MAG: dihydrodipicolinate synthase family protein [Paracoccaceae bacterium]
MQRLQGVIAPILTPFEADGSIASDIWVAHAKWVLDQGAHFLSPFGTTGEALSVSSQARMAALELLVAMGISPAVLMPGTGLTSLAETVSLTRHAVQLGVKTVMVLPSFFFKDAVEDGHFRYYSTLLEQVGCNDLRICLYNIPQNSGVAISPALAARLNQAYPDNITAYKDSTGNWQNTKAVIDAAPGISVFPGTEGLLAKALDNGGAGCISATLNLNAAAIRAIYDGKRAGDQMREQDIQANQFRAIVQAAGLVPALKSILAVTYSDSRWLNLCPPLLNADLTVGENLLKELGDMAFHIKKPT